MIVSDLCCTCHDYAYPKGVSKLTRTESELPTTTASTVALALVP